MTGDFERVRSSARQSAAAMAGRRVALDIKAAWSSAVAGRRWHAARQVWRASARGARVRWWGIAIGVAAATHLVLRSFLSPTVAPAIPASFYVAVAIAAAWTAWMADVVERAWDESRLLRLSRGRGSWVLSKTQDPRPKTPSS